jgi:hypothetical protein
VVPYKSGSLGLFEDAAVLDQIKAKPPRSAAVLRGLTAAPQP